MREDSERAAGGAEIIGLPCGGVEEHEQHDWQYSYTGYVRCPGIQNQK